MKFSHSFYRGMLLVCATAIILVVLVLVLGVIGPVRAEVDRGGTPEKALVAFWVNIGLNSLAALAVFLVFARSKGIGWISRSGLVVSGLVVLLLGLALVDAGSAYQSHGPAMQTASLLLLICAAADILAGILVFVAAAGIPQKAGVA